MNADQGHPTEVSSQSAVSILNSLARCDRAAFVTEDESSTWAEWLDDVDRLAGRLRPWTGGRVGLLVRPTARSYAAMAAMALRNCDVYLLDAAMSEAERAELSDTASLDAVIDPAGSTERAGVATLWNRGIASDQGRGRVFLFTSGSTDRPKPVGHDWTTLTKPVRRAQAGQPARWLLTYRPHLYAGLQVFFHCLLNQETLVLPEAGMPVDGTLDLMARAGVTSVSATPSYWRRLITMGRPATLSGVRLEQITLGGEVADQVLLDALARLFPRARLVHIYATSELGRCFSVKDGRAGFPAAYLDAASDEGVELKLEDDELFVRPANAGLPLAGAGDATWIGTGDLVERVGDRCFFAGRRHEILNVGGNKVQPLRVERAIQRVPGVRDVRVFGRTSSLVGQMVACEFVAETGYDERDVERAIREACLRDLAAHERPRFVEPVQTITLSEAGKKIRKSSSLPPRGAAGRPTAQDQDVTRR